MTTELDRLIVVLEADTARLEEVLRRGRRSVENFGTSAGRVAAEGAASHQRVIDAALLAPARRRRPKERGAGSTVARGSLRQARP